MPAGFVYLRDIDPTIIQDIRYAGSNNFVGRPLKGYQAAECVVKREVAALRRIQDLLAPQKLSLKMFDCYRPHARSPTWWHGRGTARKRRRRGATTRSFSKQDLFRLGYIAIYSGHSTGAALDLTLVDLTADNSATFDPGKEYGDCTASANLARRTAASTWAPAMTVPT